MDTQNEPQTALPESSGAPPAMKGRPKGSKDSKKRKPKGKPERPFGRCTNYLHHRVGHLVIVAKGPVNVSKSKTAFALWIGQCDCGNTKVVTSRAIRLGEVKTCGQSGCPFRTALLTSNLNKNMGEHIRTQIINKGAKYPFKLSADEVRALTRQPCSICGAKGKAHELRCYNPPEGYMLTNTYSLCRECVGLVPVGPGYTKSWDEMLAHLRRVVDYMSLVGHMDAGVKQKYEDALKEAEDKKPPVIPDGILCF